MSRGPIKGFNVEKMWIKTSNENFPYFYDKMLFIYGIFI